MHLEFEFRNVENVTYKEVMIFWILNKRCAIRRLNIVRSILKKQKRHLLSVSQFCKEEDISEADICERLTDFIRITIPEQ